MEILIRPDGNLTCIYDEVIDLTAIGLVSIQRASHVEPDESSQWFADMTPVLGPRLGPFALRSQALAAEQTWLEVHLNRTGPL